MMASNSLLDPSLKCTVLPVDLGEQRTLIHALRPFEAHRHACASIVVTDLAPYLWHCEADVLGRIAGADDQQSLPVNSSALRKSCACSTRPGKVSMPAKCGTFGTEKCPVATTT